MKNAKADNPEEPNSFVAFLDILGTKALIKKKRFTDFYSLDFTNVAAIAASQFPQTQIAVFSDSIILSAPILHGRQFIEALRLMYPHWYQDGIWVRGGISNGDLRWVDFFTDKAFRQLPNLSLCRVYGQALVDAVETERSSGPGAVPFVDSETADMLEAFCPGSILREEVPIFIPFTLKQTKYFSKFVRHFKDNCTEERELSQLTASCNAIDRMRDYLDFSKNIT